MSTRTVLFAVGGTAVGALLLLGAKGSQASNTTSVTPLDAGDRLADLAGVAAKGAPAAGTYTETGPVVSTPFGPVQVRVSIVDGKIGDVTAVQTPTDHELSVELNKFATPTLRTEVLKAQDAKIDIVSGATYTSDAYAQSLQAALNTAAR